MKAARKWFAKQRTYRNKNSKNVSRRFRRPGIESLEHRWMLSADPTLAAIDDVTLLANSPLLIPLDGYDADGDNVSYQVEISNDTASITTSFTSADNRSMRITVPGYGEMVLELFEDMTPRITEQIITLAEDGYYDGLIFHRVINGFMIQGGSSDGLGSAGSTLPDVDDQFHVDLQHNRSGLLSMAKSGDDTNNSQFFITEVDTRHLDYNHSIFGILIEGDDVRDEISKVDTNSNDKPLTDVVMESVEIFYDNQNAVLMLKAPEGASGEADITVTVIDHNGTPCGQETFHVTVEPDVTEGLGVNEYDPLNANPYLADVGPIYTTVDTEVTFQLSYIDVDGDLTYIDNQGQTVVEPTYFLDEYHQYTYLIADPNVSGDDVQAFSHADLYYEVDIETGVVMVQPQNGLVGVHPVSLAVAPWAFSYYYDEDLKEGFYTLRAIDSQLVPIVIQPDDPNFEPVSKLEMSIVQTPTATDEFGEIEELPENVDWMDEWESFSVEIWASTENSDEFGIHTASFDLTYNTDYYTAVEIEYGVMFNHDRTGTIDDAAGVVSNIGGTTPMYSLTQTYGYYSYDPENIEKFGDDKRVLVARVNFVPNATGGGVPLTIDDAAVQPYPQPVQDLGLTIQSAQVDWNVAETTNVIVEDAPTVDVWPMIYDSEENGIVDLGDLAFFATAYGYDVGTSPLGLGCVMDYDHSGRVDLGDLAFFAANYRHSSTSGDATAYASGFPENWLPVTSLASTLSLPAGGDSGGQDSADDGLDSEPTDSITAEMQIAYALEQASQDSSDDTDSTRQTDADIVDLLMLSGEV